MYNFGSEGAIYSCSKSIVCTGLFFHTWSGTLADSTSIPFTCSAARVLDLWEHKGFSWKSLSSSKAIWGPSWRRRSWFSACLCTASPRLLARQVRRFGFQGMQCPAVTMSTAVGRRKDAIYMSVMSLNFSSSSQWWVSFLKCFGVKCSGSGVWRDQMWWSCRGRVRRRCAWPSWEGWFTHPVSDGSLWF